MMGCELDLIYIVTVYWFDYVLLCIVYRHKIKQPISYHNDSPYEMPFLTPAHLALYTSCMCYV